MSIGEDAHSECVRRSEELRVRPAGEQLMESSK